MYSRLLSICWFVLSDMVYKHYRALKLWVQAVVDGSLSNTRNGSIVVEALVWAKVIMWIGSLILFHDLSNSLATVLTILNFLRISLKTIQKMPKKVCSNRCASVLLTFFELQMLAILRNFHDEFHPVWYFLRIILAEILGFFFVIRPQPYWRS